MPCRGAVVVGQGRFEHHRETAQTSDQLPSEGEGTIVQCSGVPVLLKEYR